MKDKKKKKWQASQFITLCIVACVGGACGSLVTRYANRWVSEDASTLCFFAVLALLLLVMYAAIFLQAVIHESGHLVFGLLSGYRFSSFRVGSFMLLRDNGQLVCKRYSLAGTGGQCLMAPPQMQDGKIPVFLYNLGGSFMNLLASAVFIPLYFAVPTDSLFSPFIIMVIVWGVADALINGVPLRLANVDNDGYNAISLRKNPAALKAFWLQLRVNEESAKGVRLKDMPDEWFALPTEQEMQNSLIASNTVLCSSRLVDQCRFDEAANLLDRLLALDSAMIGLHRNLAVCDRIYLELIRENRKEVLDRLLTDAQKKFMKSMKKSLPVIRTEYAYALLAQKNTAKVKEFASVFEKVAKAYPYRCEIESELELMALADEIAKGV